MKLKTPLPHKLLCHQEIRQVLCGRPSALDVCQAATWRVLEVPSYRIVRSYYYYKPAILRGTVHGVGAEIMRIDSAMAEP